MRRLREGLNALDVRAKLLLMLGVLSLPLLIVGLYQLHTYRSSLGEQSAAIARAEAEAAASALESWIESHPAQAAEPDKLSSASINYTHTVRASASSRPQSRAPKPRPRPPHSNRGSSRTPRRRQSPTSSRRPLSTTHIPFEPRRAVGRNRARRSRGRGLRTRIVDRVAPRAGGRARQALVGLYQLHTYRSSLGEQSAAIARAEAEAAASA